jgi:hypothetical protein
MSVTIQYVVTIECGSMSAQAAGRFLPFADKTLRNWRVSGDGPPFFKGWGHPRYRLEDIERWIADHVEGPGQRHEYFPVGRVLPEEVAKWLIASASERFIGRGAGNVAELLEYMRASGRGPLWLKFKFSRRVTYFIPDVLQWAMQHGIHSDYVMRPMVGKVVFKPPPTYPSEIEALALAMRAATM